MSNLDKINKLLGEVNKKHPGSMCIASELAPYGVYETGFPTFDALTGGIPKGKISVFAGPQHTGKTALCLQILAYQQQLDPDLVTLWTDLENAWDEEWARKLGVDVDRVVIQKYTKELNTMEKVLDNSIKFIDSEAIGMWFLDSIGALVPSEDIQNSKGVQKSLEGRKMLNLQTKLGEFFRKINPMLTPNKTTEYKGCSLILLGHIYSVPSDTGIALEEVKGGNALKHWANLRVLFRRGGKSTWPDKVKITGLDGEQKEIYPGWTGRFKLDKDRKTGREGQEIVLTFNLGRGFDSKAAVISAALGMDVFERKGGWYYSDMLPEGKINGKEKLLDLLNSDDELFATVRDKVNQLSLESHINNEENKSEETDNDNQQCTTI